MSSYFAPTNLAKHWEASLDAIWAKPGFSSFQIPDVFTGTLGMNDRWTDVAANKRAGLAANKAVVQVVSLFLRRWRVSQTEDMIGCEEL